MLFPRWFWIGLTATAIALAGISLAVAQPSIGFDPPPGVVIQDEGTTQGRARALNCTGADITCSVSAGVATLNASGGAGGSFTGIEVEVEGVVETLLKESRDELSRATLTLPATDRSPKHFVYQFGRSDRVASLLLLHDKRVAGSTSIELRDAVAEEPNGLYTELLRCRSSSLSSCSAPLAYR